MPAVELVDETFVVADPAWLAAQLHDARQWARWWPDLVLDVFMDRGDSGIRWSVTGRDWVGSLEVWLEPFADGVLVHHYQRLDAAPSRRGDALAPTSRQVARERDRRARAWKQHVFALKDAAELGRPAGAALHSSGSRSTPAVPTETA